MAKLNSFYKCEVCGNVISVVENGGGTLSCCNQEMKLLEEQTRASEGAIEKHVPVISINGNEVTVKVGEVSHPMDEDHYIELIQLIDGDKILIGKRLKPGEKPEAIFHVENTNNLKARTLCNLHGIWVSE